MPHINILKSKDNTQKFTLKKLGRVAVMVVKGLKFEKQKEVFNVREEHQVAMEKAAERTALRKLELHTENYFPHLLQQLGSNGHNWVVVSDLVERAKKLGLYSTRDMALYINAIGWLGSHAFDASEVQNLWAAYSATPGKAIARIAEFAEKKSTEGLVHG